MKKFVTGILVLACSLPVLATQTATCRGITKQGEEITIVYSTGKNDFNDGHIVIEISPLRKLKYVVKNVQNPDGVDGETSSTYQATFDRNISLTISDSPKLGMSFITGIAGSRKIKLSCKF